MVALGDLEDLYQPGRLHESVRSATPSLLTGAEVFANVKVPSLQWGNTGLQLAGVVHSGQALPGSGALQFWPSGAW